MKSARVQLVPTRRTDLVCMSCGRFRTELAVVPVGGDASRETLDSHVGVHRACLGNVHRKKGSAMPVRETLSSLEDRASRGDRDAQNELVRDEQHAFDLDAGDPP